jgi:cobalamin biosynthesis Co2+ chelatase CbiK
MKERMQTSRFKYIVFTLSIVIALCSTSVEAVNKTNHKIGILMVGHGSRSAEWNKALIDLGENVSDSLSTNQHISGFKTAFMEATTPSIANALKEFDNEGYTDVIIVPIFLTLSSHVYEDIPVICGLKNILETVKRLHEEGTEIYKPKAKVALAPQLDFSDVLQHNVLRRVKALSSTPQEEGIVLVGYGDQEFLKSWTDLFKKVGDYVKDKSGIDKCTYAWCGHIVHYSSDPTTEAIIDVLKSKKSVLVIPVLVSTDKTFQTTIIGGGIDAVPNASDHVKYKADSILPDPEVTHWVIDISQKISRDILQN